jgi:pre-mRNA-splicing factor SYF1
LTERHIAHLLESEPPRPLSAAKYLLSLARRAAKNTYIPLDGKSPYQLFVDFLELVEKYAEDVGMTEEETLELQAARRGPEEKDESAEVADGDDGIKATHEDRGTPGPSRSGEERSPTKIRWRSEEGGGGGRAV